MLNGNKIHCAGNCSPGLLGVKSVCREKIYCEVNTQPVQAEESQ